MHFYAMSYEAVLELPIKTFWLLSSNINKITAERDIRKFNLLLGSQMGGTKDGVTDQLKRLHEEMGTPIKRAVVIDNGKLDRDGLEALRTMT